MKKVIVVLTAILLFINLTKVNAAGEINVIKLNGKSFVVVEQGIGYNDPKAVFIDQNGVEHSVDPDQAITSQEGEGSYQIRYIYNDDLSSKTYTAIRNVSVVKSISNISNLTYQYIEPTSLNNITNGIKAKDGGFYTNYYNTIVHYDATLKYKDTIYSDITFNKLIYEDDNDGFIGVGYKPIPNHSNDAFIAKFDQNGTKVNEIGIGNQGDDFFYDVIKTSDNNYLAVGTYYDTSNYQPKIMLVKFDSSLTILYQENTLLDNLTIKKITEVSDGFIGITDGYYVGGNYFVKFDLSGKYLNKTQLGSTLNLNNIVTTPDDNVIITGLEGQNSHIKKLNKSGSEQWDYTIPEVNYSMFSHVIINDEGNIIVGGSLRNNTTYTQYGFIMKLDTNGTIKYKKIFDDKSNSAINYIINYSSNEYIALGSYNLLITKIIDNYQDDVNITIQTTNPSAEINSSFDELSIFSNTNNVQIDVDKPAANFINTLGTYDYTYTVDTSNVEYILKRTLYVEDHTKPVISGLKTSFDLEAGSIKPNYKDGVTVSDNSNETLEVTIDDSNVNLDCVGTYYVKYTATDSSLNKETKSVPVNVTDTIAPTITANDTITLEAAHNDPNWKEIYTIEDNSKDVLNIVTNSQTIPFDKVGEYNFTITVTDKGNNSVSKQMKFIIEDHTKPVLMNENITYDVLKGTPNDWKKVVDIQDNSSDELTLTIDDSAVDYNKLGTYKVPFTADDQSGNVLQGTFIIKIADLIKPVVQLSKTKITVIRKDKPDYNSYITATDNYSTDLKITIDDSAVHYDKVGKYKVDIYVADSSDNVTKSTITLRVVKSPTDLAIDYGIPTVVAIFLFTGIVVIIKKLDGKYD